MSSERISESGVCVSSVIVTDSSVKPLRPRSSRSEVVLRRNGAERADQLRLEQLLRLGADGLARGVALVDADGAGRLLNVVFVRLDADVELGGEVRRDVVLRDERFVAGPPDGEPDGRER
jgi:hypothetical protein